MKSSFQRRHRERRLARPLRHRESNRLYRDPFFADPAEVEDDYRRRRQ